MAYEVVTWPDVQELMGLEEFEEHSYLISDENGMKKFGPSAYLVDIDWLMDVCKIKELEENVE